MSRTLRRTGTWAIALVLLASSADAQRIDSDLEELARTDVQSRYQSPTATLLVELEDGDDFQVVVDHTNEENRALPLTSTRRPLVVLRVFAPDETMLLHRVVDTQTDSYPTLEADDYADGLLADHRFTASETGIYTIRVSANWEHSRVSLGAPSGRPVALSHNNGRFREWRPNPERPLFAHVPSSAPYADASARVCGVESRGGVTFRGATDIVVDASTGCGDSAPTLPGGSYELVTEPGWRFRALIQGSASRAGRAPLFTSTSREFAARMSARAQRIGSGPLEGEYVAHAYQRRFAENTLPQLFELMDSVPLFAFEASASAAYADEACHGLESDDERREGAVIYERTVPSVIWALRNFRYGTDADNGLVDFADEPALNHAFIDALRSDSLCNPWRADRAGAADMRRALLARLMIANAAWLLATTDDERQVRQNDFSWATGISAFRLLWNTEEYFEADVALRELGELFEPVDNAFLDGMRRRVIAGQVHLTFGGNHNQTAHRLPPLVYLGNRLGGAYQDIARAYTQHFADAQSDAGWHTEAYGPDASYEGITHAIVAEAYLLSGRSDRCEDPALRRSLQRSYQFFNLTVAPEPGGTLVSAYPFSYRTNWGSHTEQYGGATRYAPNLPEVAVRHERYDDAAPIRDSLALEAQIARAPAGSSTLASAGRRVAAISERRDISGDYTLLFDAEDSTRRNMLRGESTLAVRREGYYAFMVVGGPPEVGGYGDVIPASPRDDCPGRYLAFYEDSGVPIPAYQGEVCPGVNYKGHRPYVGGGLGMLWTPAFGSAVFGVNWSPLSRHGVVTIAEDNRSWPDHRMTTLDTSRIEDDIASVSGPIVVNRMAPEASPILQSTRTYQFDDGRVEIELLITNDSDSPLLLDRMFENVPFLACTADDCERHMKKSPTRFEDADGSRLAEGSTTTSAVSVLDADGHGVRIEFDEPREVLVRSIGLTQDRFGVQQINRLEIPMPTRLEAGGSASLSYAIVPLDDDVERTGDRPEWAPLECTPPPMPMEDAGVADGGTDAGTGADTGADSSGPDAGEMMPTSSGCGCRVAGDTNAPTWLLIGFACLAWRRRRRDVTPSSPE